MPFLYTYLESVLLLEAKIKFLDIPDQLYKQHF